MPGPKEGDMNEDANANIPPQAKAGVSNMSRDSGLLGLDIGTLALGPEVFPCLMWQVNGAKV